MIPGNALDPNRTEQGDWIRMSSNNPSPKKKFMDKIFSGMSPGKRRVSVPQYDAQSVYSSDYSDDNASSYQLSRQSSLRSTCTSFDLTSTYNSIPEEMPAEDELNEMFSRFLIDINLGGNPTMLAKKSTDKWKLLQAHHNTEQRRVDNPLLIVDKMESMLCQLRSTQRSDISPLRFLDRKILESLKISFRTASISWLNAFVESGGCDLMVQILKQIYPERNSAHQITWMIEAVKTFSNCPFGIDCFVNHDGLLETLVLFIDSNEMKIKQSIIHILTAIAYTNTVDGPFKILNAFSNLQKILHEEDRFDCLLRVLEKNCKAARRGTDKEKVETAQKFVSDCLIFFNLLLEDIGDFHMRVAVRCQILREPFKHQFEVHLTIQIDSQFYRDWKRSVLLIKSPCSRLVLRWTKVCSAKCSKTKT